MERRIVTNASEAKTRSLAGPVAALNPDDRSIIDLSMRYGFSDERLAAMLHVDPEHVARRREEALAWLGQEAGIDAQTDRPRLERALGEVSHDVWLGRSAAEWDRESPPVEPPVVAVAPASSTALPRRRPSAWPLAAGLVAVAAVLVAAALLIGEGDDAADPAGSLAPGQGVAPVALDPLPGAGSTRASMRLIGPGPPPRVALDLRSAAEGSGPYEVWLYNSVIDAQPLAKLPQGGGTTRFELPESASGYRYIDVSEEKPGGFPGHSGRSVERVGLPAALAALGLSGG